MGVVLNIECNVFAMVLVFGAIGELSAEVKNGKTKNILQVHNEAISRLRLFTFMLPPRMTVYSVELL
ncbi:MAG: hypothetical protein CXR30_17605 [Geobacter sp.]|nr:MAG: hypothetical protein CXR30_17605 [Geobacter sp.]